MTDPSGFGQQPAYWDKCEEMSYARLRWFIDHALELLSASSDSSQQLPRSEEEFLALCDMLKSKADALKEGGPLTIPDRPRYVGPRNPGSEFVPSPELASLYSKRKQALRRVDNA